jgi:hypothetical protein
MSYYEMFVTYYGGIGMSQPIDATIVEVELPDEVWNRDGLIVVELVTGERLGMRYGPDAKGALPEIGQKITLSYRDFMTLQRAQPQPPAPHIDLQPQFPAKTWDNKDPFGDFQSTYNKPAGVVLIVVFNLLLSMFGLLFGFLMLSISSAAILFGAIFFIIGVFLLVVSYGLYRLQSWARIAYMIFSVLICFTILGAVIGVPILIYLFSDVKNSFD